MSSMAPYPGLAALEARVAALEAERLAPVPRATHAIGIDVDDLALVLHFIDTDAKAAGLKPRPAAVLMTADTLAAYQRLEAAVLGHAARSAA